MKQPEDGLKWAETCSCGIYVHFVHKLGSVLTANYTLYLFIEHNGDVTLKSCRAWNLSTRKSAFSWSFLAKLVALSHTTSESDLLKNTEM
jgi:hypothetical protein